MGEQNEQSKQQNKQEVHCWDANNPEHIKKTFVEEQGINRNVELCALVRHLQSNRGRHYVVALDGEWGCGKSFFVRHTILLHDVISGTENGFYEKFDKEKQGETKGIAWKEVEEHCKKICGESAESRNDDWKDPDEYLYYDAWKNDAFDGEPIISIIFNCLQHHIKNNTELAKVIGDALKLVPELAVKANTLLTLLGDPETAAIMLGTGTVFGVVEKIWKWTREHKQEKNKNEPDSLSEYKSLHEKIKEIISNALGDGKEKRFIIFIDELDRCNPRFAVKVLERVKHFFDNENLVFVFSVNLDQLQHTIKEVYGQNFDAMNYLHRFFDYQITLSTPDIEQFVEDKLNFIVKEADAIRDSARYAIESYELSIRDTIRYIDALKIVYYSICAELKKRQEQAEQKKNVADAKQPAYRFVLEVIAPLLLGQKIADADRYNTVVSQRKVQEYDKKPLFKERITNYLTTRNIKYAEYLDPSIVREGQKNLLEESVAEKAYDSIFPLNQKQDLPWGKKYKLTRATRRSLLSIMGGLAPQKKSDSQDIWEYTGKRAPRAGEIMTPRAGEIMTIRIENVDFHFVYCPAGRFTMGSPEEEKGRGVDETQHEVTLTEGFWIGKYEVTQGQYKAITGKNPSHFKGDNRPVEMVFWYESVTFCQKLNRLKIAPRGYMFMFPTEAEWEYACRAGTTTALNSGKPVTVTSEDGECPNLDEVGWYGENSGGQTHPVMEKEPNAWGIYDMHGNVCEWCADKYGDYPKGAVTDPEGPELGVYRVLRGGCWSGFAGICQSAYRNYDVPDDRSNRYGFRLVLIPEQKTASPRNRRSHAKGTGAAPKASVR